jgi:hypothetical protein
MVNNSSNINKPKESLNSDGQQFLQYQQTKRKFEQWWSTILPISTNQKKVLTVWLNYWPSLFKLSYGLLILVELSTITVKTFLWFVDIGGIVDNLCLINFLKFEQWWSTIPPISIKQKKVLTVMIKNSININKTRESLNSDC